MKRRTFLGTLSAGAMCGAAAPPLRLGMAGLEHGHAAAVVTACARRKIPVMMEKPLAVDIEQARVIERAATGGYPCAGED